MSVCLIVRVCVYVWLNVWVFLRLFSCASMVQVLEEVLSDTGPEVVRRFHGGTRSTVISL